MEGDDTPPPAGFAGHLKAALVGAHEHLADKIDDRKKAHVANVLEQFEADIAPMLEPLMREVLDNPGTPEQLKTLLAQVGAPEHFSSSLLIGVAVGAIIGPVLGSATAPYVQSISNAAWSANPTRPLTPDVLAATILKGIQSVDDAAPEAALSGIDRGRLATMVEAAGNAIGFQEALSLQRRGLLDGTTLEQVLEYSNVNPQFYAAALNLLYAPPSISEVLAGRVKSHLSDTQAQKLFVEAGGNPINYEWERDTAGRPPGTEQMLHLWNRGDATEADVDAAIAQSDIAPHFAPFVKLLRVYYPPVRSIVPMLRSGAIDETEARSLFTKQGVPDNIQDAFIKEAKHTSSSGVKELSQAQVVRAYSNRTMDQATARARLLALGYPAADADVLLELADDVRAERLLNATIGKIGTLYIAHKLTKNEATTALGTADVPAAAQHDLFVMWDVQHDAVSHQPSPAGIVGAYRRGLIDAPATRTRLLGLGIDQDDIAIFVVDGYPPSAGQEALDNAVAVAAGHNLPGDHAGAPPAKAKHLTATQIGKLFVQGAITQQQAVAQLVALGYTADDAAALLFLASPQPGA